MTETTAPPDQASSLGGSIEVQAPKPIWNHERNLFTCSDGESETAAPIQSIPCAASPLCRAGAATAASHESRDDQAACGGASTAVVAREGARPPEDGEKKGSMLRKEDFFRLFVPLQLSKFNYLS